MAYVYNPFTGKLDVKGLGDTVNTVAPVALGCITLTGTAASASWTGTAGYTVVGVDQGPGETEITLTFPSAYSARTDYIVHTDFDYTAGVPGNSASIGISRSTGSVLLTLRRWDESQLQLGEIMVTIYNL